MPATNDVRLIAEIGLAMQCAGAAALAALFVLVRRHLHRRDYFVVWGDAFVALLIGLGTLLALYLFPMTAWQDLGLFVYLAAKTSYYALLLTGTVMHARGTPHRRFKRFAVGVAVAWAALAFTLAHDASYYVVWQSPIATTALAGCGLLLASMPAERRSLGSRLTSITFFVCALVWALYSLVYLDVLPSAVRAVAPYNSYLDLLLQTVLGFGMVLILLEGERREIDAAHAALAVAHDQLLDESYRDALTGTFNRRAFTEGIGLESASASFGCVVMLDLDDLKDINDGLGHHVGDEVLKHLVAELKLSLRKDDKLYRMGGDEFLVVMPQGRAEQAAPRLDLLLKKAPRLPAAGSERGLRLKVSVGAADFATPADLGLSVREGDQRMYDTKRRRKGSGELDTHPGEVGSTR